MWQFSRDINARTWVWGIGVYKCQFSRPLPCIALKKIYVPIVHHFNFLLLRTCLKYGFRSSEISILEATKVFTVIPYIVQLWPFDVQPYLIIFYFQKEYKRIIWSGSTTYNKFTRLNVSTIQGCCISNPSDINHSI